MLVKRLLLPFLAAVFVATLAAGCAETADEPTRVSIVASTDVYGSIAAAIGGDDVAVTSIIDNPNQDPHDFEASARTQLRLSRADIVIANGGGYDDFMDRLLSGAENSTALLLRVVEISGRSKEQIETNEHVWYDLDTIRALSEALEKALANLDPEHAETFRANQHRFDDSLDRLQGQVDALAEAHRGQGVLVTEPVPLYLLEDAGLVNRTPAALSTALEDGRGVAPAVMKSALNLLASGGVALLAYNEQTQGPETALLVSSAREHGVPAVPVTETLTGGQDYLHWMGATIDEIAQALL